MAIRLALVIKFEWSVRVALTLSKSNTIVSHTQKELRYHAPSRHMYPCG